MTALATTIDGGGVTSLVGIFTPMDENYDFGRKNRVGVMSRRRLLLVKFSDVFSRNADVFTMHCTFSQTVEGDRSMAGVACETKMRHVAAVKLG